MEHSDDIGCLLIDEGFIGGGALEPLRSALAESGVRAERFAPDGPGDLHLQLQRSYQRIRRDGAISAAVGYGVGCDCALALAGQLPADRLVLLEPLQWVGAGELGRQLRRIRRYALRGAAFCVAPVLIVPGPRTPEGALRGLRRALSGGMATVAGVPLDCLSARKDRFNSAILHFLRHGVLPKSLAENPEMCIIYG